MEGTIVSQNGVIIQLGWAGIGIVLAILGHAGFTIWHTATFKTTLILKIDGLVDALSKMDKELEKRDEKIAAAWKKIDAFSERLIIVETKNGIAYK